MWICPSPLGPEATGPFFAVAVKQRRPRLLLSLHGGKDPPSALGGVGERDRVGGLCAHNRYLTEQISSVVDAVRARGGADDGVIRLVRGWPVWIGSRLRRCWIPHERYGGVPGLSAELGFSQEELPGAQPGATQWILSLMLCGCLCSAKEGRRSLSGQGLCQLLCGFRVP